MRQLPQIHADRGQDLLAFGIVRERIQQVLERQVRVPTRARFAVGDRENDFESGAEHKGTDALGFGYRLRMSRAAGAFIR